MQGRSTGTTGNHRAPAGGYYVPFQQNGIPQFPRGGGYDASQFYNFYMQLQYSAMVNTRMAYRQMQMMSGGIQAPPANFTRSYQTAQQVHQCMYYRPSSNNVVDFKDKTGSGSNIPLRQVIPLITISEDASQQAALNKTIAKVVRKVNFAYPISTIKIKSPTPNHSYEDLRSSTYSGGGGYLKVKLQARGDTPVMDYYYFSSEIEEDSDDVHDHPATFVNGYVNVNSQNAETCNKRKKKRKNKRKKHLNARETEENKTDSFYNENEVTETDSVYNEDDPYASFEVPLNKNDYHFQSEIRLCTAEPQKKNVEECTTEIRNDTSAVGQGSKADEEVLNQMKDLYGAGTERIIKMEEAIEFNFRRESKRTN